MSTQETSHQIPDLEKNNATNHAAASSNIAIKPDGASESSSLCAQTRVRALVIALVVSVLLLAGALALVGTEYKNDTNSGSNSYQTVGSTIPTAETERNVYSTTPVAVSQPSPGNPLRLALGDMSYVRPGDTVPWEGPSASRGRVRVFELVKGEKYQQVGQTLEGSTALSYFGASVALSSDGRWLAVGAVGVNDFAGSVFLYSYDTVDRQWKLQRDDTDFTIPPEARCGNDVQLSSGKEPVLVFACSQFEEIWSVQLSADDEDTNRINFASLTIYLKPAHRPWALQLSQDGMSMLVSDANPSENSVYDWVNDAWKLRGGDDDANSSSLYLRLLPDGLKPQMESETRAVTMSADGSLLAAVYVEPSSSRLVIQAFWYYGATWTSFGEPLVLPPSQQKVGRLLLSAGGEYLLVVSQDSVAQSLTIQVYSQSELGSSAWEPLDAKTPLVKQAGMYPTLEVYDVAMTYDASIVAASFHKGPTEFYAQTFQLQE